MNYSDDGNVEWMALLRPFQLLLKINRFSRLIYEQCRLQWWFQWITFIKIWKVVAMTTSPMLSAQLCKVTWERQSFLFFFFFFFFFFIFDDRSDQWWPLSVFKLLLLHFSPVHFVQLGLYCAITGRELFIISPSAALIIHKSARQKSGLLHVPHCQNCQ